MTQSGTSSSRATGVKDTTAATFQNNTLASITSDAKQLKNVFLYRTGNYVATYKRTSSGSSNGISYSIGALPTSDGNNYGPVACPSQNLKLTDAKATAMTAENLRMCGSTGKWVYYNAINLLVDASHAAKFTADAGTTTEKNIAAVPFLAGRSNYRSGTTMADARQVKLLSGSTATSSVLHTSAVITPGATGASKGETAGTWRSYGVVFYCDDYARTDLTACKTENHKMFYVADPNPGTAFGTTSAGISGAGTSSTGGTGSGTGSSTTSTGSSTSGAFVARGAGAAGAALAATVFYAI